MTTILYEGKVLPEWVDYNGHMNDAAYAQVFSISVDRVMKKVGITDVFREASKYTIYTLETHVSYLAETFKGEPIYVTLQLLDRDEKLLHVFFVMKNKAGENLATSEQMLIGINQETGRPERFPGEVEEKVQALYEAHQSLPTPTEAGRSIGIKRK